MAIGQGSGGNDIPGTEEIVSCGNVITRFVPVVRQAQQGKVRQVDAYEEQGEDEPERQRAGGLCLLFGKDGHEPPKTF